MTRTGLFLKVWLSITAIILALSSGFISALCYLALRERPKKQELRERLEKYSEMLLSEYVRKFHSLETEWDDMYQKFGKLAGRMDRQKYLDSKVPPEETPQQSPPPPPSRSDLLKRWRASR